MHGVGLTTVIATGGVRREARAKTIVWSAHEKLLVRANVLAHLRGDQVTPSAVHAQSL